MRDRLAITTLLLISLLASVYLWGPGMVNTRGGGDSPFLLQRTQQMVTNLQAGVFPVRWMPDAAYGLGYPFFSYYAALPYYLAALCVLVGLDILTALKLVQTAGFVVAALAMYGWSRRVIDSNWAAWLAAVAYTFAPFHVVNVYVRGDSLSEFYAFVWYPLILWALDRIQDSRSGSPMGRIATAAVAYAALILTHNISALVFSPLVLLYLVALALRNPIRRRHLLAHGLLALGLGILLATWFWVPALAEVGQVRLGPSTEGYFHYSRHFRALNLVQKGLLFEYAIGSATKGVSPFAMGLPQAAFAALGIALLVTLGWRREWRRAGARRFDARWVCILVGLLVSTVMITPLSQPVWEHVPLLPVVQFPWRFLSVQALFAAAVTAALVPEKRGSGWVAVGISAILALSVILPLRPDRLPISSDDVTIERLQLYELFGGNLGTTIRYEWLPNAVARRPFTSDALVEPDVPLRAVSLDGMPLDAVLVERRPTSQVWQVVGEGGGVAFPLHYWPGWSASVDGEGVDTWPVEGSGYIALALPAGEHVVAISLRRTPVRAFAEVVSAASAVLLLVALIRARIREHREVASASQHGVSGRRFWQNWGGDWLSSVFLSLGVLVFAIFLLPPHEEFDTVEDLTMDFLQRKYLHHNPGGVRFGDLAHLTGYDLSAETLSPGDTLTVKLRCSEAQSGATATVQLVSPAAVRHEVQPLAADTQPLARGSASGIQTSLALNIPEDIPRGIYLVEMRLSGPEGERNALTPGGWSRGTLYLRPVRIPRGPSLPSAAAVLVPFGPAIRLHAAVLSQIAPARLAVKLDWSTEYQLAANYGISLRLQDPNGQTRVAQDAQPGYGFLPTSMWRPGERITDRYTLALPDDIPSGSGYQLVVVLYQLDSLEPVGQARLGSFALPLVTPFEAQPVIREFVVPDLDAPLEVDFGSEIRLLGYALEREENDLRLVLWWQALRSPSNDYTVFVHLFDPLTEEIIEQSDAMPRGGAYPTSWWAETEIVSDTVRLDLGHAPAGSVQIALGLVDQTMTRLPATGADGERIRDDRLVLSADTTVER